MSKIQDLTGMRFGRLTAIEPMEERRGASVVWKCECDCGNIKLVPISYLRNGTTKSCGCLNNKRKADLLGQRFGMLSAVRPTEERRNGSVVWECRCDCGNTCFVTAGNLLNGNTKSCGCRCEKISPGQRFGKLTVMRPMEQRCNNSVVWECKCDCGKTTFVTTSRLNNGNMKSCGCLRREQRLSVSLNLTGVRVGSLTVVGPTKERKNGSVVWECKCDCGKTIFVASSLLNSGKKDSCGCMPKKRKHTKDLSGQRFGMLTAVRPTEEKRNGSVVWECRCDCGKTTFVTSHHLNNGDTKSCGCTPKKRKHTKDLSGQRFGMLTVVGPTKERKNGSVVWECKCDCGKSAFIPTGNLKRGATKSCGCRRRLNRDETSDEVIASVF